MSAPIELTDAEIAAAAGALYDGEAAGKSVGTLLALAIDAVNAVRLGDPVGTLRRNPDTGAVAERQGEEGSRYWHLLVHNGERMVANSAKVVEDADNWHLIYEPGKASLVMYLWTPPQPPEVKLTAEPQRPGECVSAMFCRDFSCVGSCKPREVERLGDAERHARWRDYEDDVWQFDHERDLWGYREKGVGGFCEIQPGANPSDGYGPFTEVFDE